MDNQPTRAELIGAWNRFVQLAQNDPVLSTIVSSVNSYWPMLAPIVAPESLVNGPPDPEEAAAELGGLMNRTASIWLDAFANQVEEV